MRFCFSGLILFISLICLAGCQQERAVTPSGKTIKVGIIGPLAFPAGDKGFKGIKTAQMIEPYTKDGDKIELSVFDDKLIPAETVKLYKELAKNEEFKSVIILSTSKEMIPVSYIADLNKLPIIGTIATHSDITRNTKYVGRVCFSDNRQGKVAAIYARDELLIDRVAILYDDHDTYSINLKNIFRTSFRAIGGKVVAALPLQEFNQDLITYLNELKDLDVQLLYMVVNSTYIIEILKALDRIDWQVKKMGADGVLAVVSFRLKENLDLLDGFIATDHISTERYLTELGEKGLETYLEQFGAPDSYTALGFEAYFLLKHALDQCRPKYSRDCIAENIRNVETFTGVQGKFPIIAGDSLRPVMINEIKDARLKLIVKVY